MTIDTSSILVRAIVGVIAAAVFWIIFTLVLAALEFSLSTPIMRLIGVVVVILTLIYIATGRKPIN